MRRTPAVVVIGGGATGVGTARDLAMRGLDVTLVERGGLAGGTSGRSHGVCHSGARYAEDDSEGAAACLDENEILREIAPHCVRDAGGLFVRLDEDDPAYFEEKVAACRDLGMAVEVCDGEAARAAVPSLTERVERAMRVPDRVVFPSRLVAVTAESAKNHGATIHPHAPVEDVHVEDGCVTGATVGGAVGERIRADVVVNATGPWAERCAALAGVDLPMRPTAGVMVAVDSPGIDPVLNRCRPPADGDIVVPHGQRAILGTTSTVVGDPDDYPKPDADARRVVEECAAMVPALAESEVRRTYWGVRPLYDPDEAARGDTRGISRDFALVDHADDGAAGFVSIVGGKLTTHRRMAEAVADRVCAFLGVEEPCRTADEPLPGDSPADADEYVAAFDAASPADEDVVDAPQSD